MRPEVASLIRDLLHCLGEEMVRTCVAPGVCGVEPCTVENVIRLAPLNHRPQMGAEHISE